MPVVFLQRHALELKLKDLIESANDIDADQDRVDQLKLDRAAFQQRFPEPAPRIHGLVSLANRLSDGLKRLEYELPAGVLALARKLHRFEGMDASATRYPELLGKDFEARLSEVQNELEDLFEAHLHPASLFDEEENLADELVMRSNTVGQDGAFLEPDDVLAGAVHPSAVVVKGEFLTVRSVSPEEQLKALLKQRRDLKAVDMRKEPDGSLKILLGWTDAEKRRRGDRNR